MLQEQITILDIAWGIFSLGLFTVWLIRTRFGIEAFGNSVCCGHNVRWYDILAIVFVFLLVAVASAPPGADAEPSAWDNFLIRLIIGQLVTVGTIIAIASYRFDDSLSGFGFDISNLPRDIVRGILWLIAVLGLVGMVLIATLRISEFCGYETIQKHVLLEKLSDNPAEYTVFLLIVTAAIAAPLTEELLFRGILQSFSIKILSRFSITEQNIAEPVFTPANIRWAGIIITAAIFALFHADWQHWPALFVFGISLGYARERSGGLVAPLVMHSLFNTLPLLVTLTGIAE